MVDVVEGLCFVVDDDVFKRSIGIELHADFIDDIWIKTDLLGVSSYSLLKLPCWISWLLISSVSVFLIVKR